MKIQKHLRLVFYLNIGVHFFNLAQSILNLNHLDKKKDLRVSAYLVEK